MKLIKPKKKFGQHFLTDQKISQKIVDLLTLKNYDTIIEVGPGTGALTKNIIKLKINGGSGGLVDTLVLGTSSATSEGSSPFSRTIKG